MKINKLLLLPLFIVFNTQAAFFVENGQIKAEVQTYSKNNQKIVLIDMVHVGPKSYYKGVSAAMREFENSNAIILEEGVRHCDKKGDVLMLPGEKANFKVLEELYEQRLVMNPESAREELIAAGFEEKKCQNDSVIKEPGFLERFSSRFSLYGLIAGVAFLRSQGTIANLYPDNIQLASGDIASAKFINVVEKAAAGSIVQCLLALQAKGGCIQFKEWAKTEVSKKIQDDVIINRRNDVLLGITFNTLSIPSSFGTNYDFNMNSKKFDTVILPWGAAHMPGGLLEAIEKMGFVKSKKEGVVYTSCERFKRNPILYAILSEDESIKTACN